MDEQGQTGAIATALPEPPPFYQHFTSSNIEKINALRATQLERQSDSKSTFVNDKLPVRVHNLPAELRFLQPPEPPSAAEGKFRCFGDVYYVKEKLPTLQDMGVEQVYTPPSTPSSSQTHFQSTTIHHDHAFILKRLAKSLLLNFLELIGIMASNSSQWAEKVHDIRTLSINFHHLLNEYRPHQARESLILLMKEQLECRKAEIRGVKECREKMEKILEELNKIEVIEEEALEPNPKIDEEVDIYKALEKQYE